MDKILEKLEPFYGNLTSASFSLLKGIGFILVAWLILVLILKIIKRFLKFSKIEKLNDWINNNEFIKENSIKVDLSLILFNVAKYLILIILVFIGAELLGLTVVSQSISKFLGYLPKLLTAILIFLGGIYLATQIKMMIGNMLKSIDASGSKAIGTVVFYLILIFVTITALNQAGIDTSIISNNLTFILGAVLIAMTIAVGLGSKDIVYRLILGYYSKRNLKVGMKIMIGDTTGIIDSIDNITMVLKTENDKIIYPIKKINNSKIVILQE